MLTHTLDSLPHVVEEEEVHEVAILQDGLMIGDQCLPVARDEGHAGTTGGAQVTAPPAQPVVADVNLGEDHGAAGIAVLILRAEREHAAQELPRRPGHGGDRRDAQPLVDLRPTRIVDAGDDLLDPVGLPGHPGRQDVRVVTGAHGGEGMGSLDAGTLERLAIEAHTGHRLSGEIGAELPEGPGILIDDRHGVSELVQSMRQQGSHATAPENHDVHARTLHAWRSEAAALPGVGSPDVAASDVVKRLFVGRALTSERLSETMLPKRIALPVFASDALSSNAYATQEILLVLSLGGFTLYQYGPWIAAAVVLVFFTVIASYRQTVHAYPNGGGDYEVVARNLGPNWGVFVGSALLIDYVLTVAVSISAAVANLGSIIPFVEEHNVWFAVGLIALVTVINLRGVKESGAFFAVPVYLFIGSILLMMGWAIIEITVLGQDLTAESAGWDIVAENSFAGAALAFLVARAFSSGTTALTGIEAVANGVPAFREPKSRNAATTLALLGVISMTLFAGITWLAIRTQVKITENDADLIGLPPGQAQKTVIVQVADAVFHRSALPVLLIAIVTAVILALAANTAFNGFPVLGSVLARDGYLPRQLHTRGDRLAYSNGIITLAALAIVLVVGFQADVSSLIQLYIIGVFVSFTLSQWGMIRHWTREIPEAVDSAVRRRMQRSRIVNSIGLVMTGTVLVIVLTTKFTKGAWIVVVAIPVIYVVMRVIHRHYERVRTEMMTFGDAKVTLPARVHVIVLVSKLHKPTMRALAYARASRPTVLEAVTVDVDHEETVQLQREWERQQIPVTLKILASPYREITRPVLDYVGQLRAEHPQDLVTIFIPEYVVGHWWEQLLHNQSALRLKSRLLFVPGVMVTSVPWQLDADDDAAESVNRGSS